MKHLVVISNLFDINQKIQVYSEGECIQELTCKIENLEYVCYAVCKEYNIHLISFHGVPFVGEKLQKELTNSTEFNDFDIVVDIL